MHNLKNLGVCYQLLGCTIKLSTEEPGKDKQCGMKVAQMKPSMEVHGAKVDRCSTEGCTIKSSEAECAEGMEQKEHALPMVVQNRLSKEEFVSGMGQSL